MKIRPALALPVLLSATFALALTGCSPSAPTSAPSPSQPAASTPTAAPAGTGPDACKAVTAAMIQSAYGYDPGTGTSKDGFGGTGSTECDYDGTGKTIVQVSLQADTYYPATIYDKSQVPGAADPDGTTGADRGYIAPGAVLVVKGSVGVFVTTIETPGIPAGQALAKAIVAGL